MKEAPESIKEHPILLLVVLVVLIVGVQVFVSLNALIELKVAANERVRLASGGSSISK